MFRQFTLNYDNLRQNHDILRHTTAFFDKICVVNLRNLSTAHPTDTHTHTHTPIHIVGGQDTKFSAATTLECCAKTKENAKRRYIPMMGKEQTGRFPKA